MNINIWGNSCWFVVNHVPSQLTLLFDEAKSDIDKGDI
jgi:hypothetical protein